MVHFAGLDVGVKETSGGELHRLIARRPEHLGQEPGNQRARELDIRQRGCAGDVLHPLQRGVTHLSARWGPAGLRAALTRHARKVVAQGRDPAQLKAVLREDAVVLSDGGGRKPAALNPIRGADRIARFFFGLLRKTDARGGEISIAPAMLNGAPGLLVHLNGVLDQALTFSVDGDRIAALYAVRNPDKLRAFMH